jgi:hypothetical protein
MLAELGISIMRTATNRSAAWWRCERQLMGNTDNDAMQLKAHLLLSRASQQVVLSNDVVGEVVAGERVELAAERRQGVGIL